jgi:predicted ArsR family transcriptional regulator
MPYIGGMKDLTIKEIAEKLGISQTAAKARLFRLGIKPDKLIGNTGIYPPSVIEKIRTVNSVGRPKAETKATKPKPAKGQKGHKAEN